MKKKLFKKTIVMIAALSLAVAMLSGCAKTNTTSETSEPVVVPLEPMQSEPVEPTVTPGGSDGQEDVLDEKEDGQRFEKTIILEGMEESVTYEHVKNKALGFAMDYECESLERRSEADRECFISVYDDGNNPENYLEVSASSDSVEAAAEAIKAELSETYEITVETIPLENSGDCTKISASCLKNTNETADNMQAVYIIAAPDGCRIARAHYYFEAAEGFGRRFSYMVNSLIVFSRQ